MIMKKKLILRIIFSAITLSIMLFVFLNSSKNAVQSSEISMSFTEKLFSAIVPDYNTMTPTQQFSLISGAQFVIRKSAHFITYFFMGLFCMLAVNTYGLKAKIKALYASLICIGFSITDETHQIFVPGRSGEIRDILIDSVGILLAVAIVFIFIRERKMKDEW